MWVWVGINYLLCLWLSVSTKFYRLVLCNPPALLLALFFGLITSSMTIGVWPLMLKWSPIIEPRQPQNQQPPDSLMARSPRHRYKFNRYRKGPLKEDVFLEMQTLALSIWTYKKSWSNRCNFFQKMSKKLQVLDQVHFKKIYNDWISQHL